MNNYNMNKFTVIITTFSIFLSSCCSMRERQNEQLFVNSYPQGATITVDGYPCGQTPQLIEVPPKYQHTLLVEKEGYQPQEMCLQTKPKVGQLATNGVFPIAGLVAGAGVGLLADLMIGSITYLPIFTGYGAAVGLAAGLAGGVGGAIVDNNSGEGRELISHEVTVELTPADFTIYN